MSIIKNNYTIIPFNFISPGYYGQKLSDKDCPEELKKPSFSPQKTETYVELCKRYAWTVLPLLTLIKPVGSAVTIANETAKTLNSVDLIMKYHTLQSISYNAFKIALSAGIVLFESIAIIIEPYTQQSLCRLFTAIQLLSFAHQTALELYRYENNSNTYKYCKLAIHVLCNGVAMLLLFRQNLYLNFSFFVLQGIAAMVHAILQASKKNYLAASIDIIMQCVRFFQAYQIMYRLQRRHIDSREPIKLQLTRDEERLKNLGREAYLYFKQNGPEKKFLILTAESDHNGALDPFKLTDLIDQASKLYDVKLRTFSTVQDIPREIQHAGQFGHVIGLVLNLHGSLTFMRISGNKNGLLTYETISPDLFSELDPHCVIALNSCNTASDPDFGVAYRVANASKKITFAPDGAPYGITLSQLDPLEFGFERPGKTVKTVKIQPIQPRENNFEKPREPVKTVKIDHFFFISY